MDGIIDEGKDMMDADAPTPVSNAALIGSAQRYGTVRTFAQQLG